MSGPTRRCSAIWSSTIAPMASMSGSIRNSRRIPPTIRASGRRTRSICWRSISRRMRRRRPDGSSRPIRSGRGRSITLLPEGVNLDVCKPNPQVRRRNLRIGDATIRPNEKLVTYVARDLEPYRGFHVMMRAVPHLLRARKDIRVVMVGGDGISYGMPPPEGTWRQKMLAELGDSIDPTAGGVSRSRRLPDLCRDAAALGRACLSDLSVRCVMVAARGAGRGLRRDRQRHTDGERVRHARAERAAGAVLRSEGTGGQRCCGCWRMRHSHAGCGRMRGVMPRSTWR